MPHGCRRIEEQDLPRPRTATGLVPRGTQDLERSARLRLTLNDPSHRPDRCPLCGQPNHCVMVTGGGKCWCESASFPPATTDALREAGDGRACVCRQCSQAEPAKAPTVAVPPRAQAAAVPVASPCIGVCSLDPVSRTCRGCKRTVSEIAGWASMGNDERQAVLDHLGER